ncbi:C2H2-like zinc finger protein [Perilla frutescens var. frutescens]|nr:C2H2-like zinc finger protein [Perilla frutescens var. frutescens]
MAVLSTPTPADSSSKQPKKQASNSNVLKKRLQPQSSWDQIKNIVTCKPIEINSSNKNPSPLYSSCSKICTFRDIVHGNTRIVDRADKSPEHAAARVKKSGCGASSSSGGGMQLRKLSGCYECHAIVDLSRHPLPRNINIFSCSQCGEIFPKIESLELHQALKHAVSELGPDDSSRNIVEIIFKSSWLKRANPICEIERILKVHNTQRTIQRFEDHRASVKLRARRNANARCAADGNELLRFHAAAITCNLGARGSSSLCGSSPTACGICTIIRHGFRSNRGASSGIGICTTASSGRADDYLGGGSGPRRAALVCRVIAGRVKPRVAEDAAVVELAGSYDSLAGCAGAYSNMEELYVFSSRAILPCFVVIYKALQ